MSETGRGKRSTSRVELLWKKVDSGGELDEEETRFVLDELRKPDSPDTEALLMTLGRNYDPRHAGVVEPFLEAPHSPTIARRAILVLMIDLGLADRYPEEILRFLDGVDWDSNDEIRGAAISAAGVYLEGHLDRRMLECLMAIAADPTRKEWLVQAARFALARALHHGPTNFIDASRVDFLHISDDQAQPLLREARSLADSAFDSTG